MTKKLIYKLALKGEILGQKIGKYWCLGKETVD
jgi:hypothetical protein